MIGSARIIDRSLAEGAKSHISYHIRSHQVLCLSIAMFSYAFLYIGIFIYIGNWPVEFVPKKWQATSPKPSSLFFSRWPHSPHSDWPATHPNGAARNDGPWTEWGSGPGLWLAQTMVCFCLEWFHGCSSGLASGWVGFRFFIFFFLRFFFRCQAMMLWTQKGWRSTMVLCSSCTV